MTFPASSLGVYGALARLQSDAPEPITAIELKPAVSIKKSITPDFIICLEDGRSFKSLKRHLRTAFDMTPDDYRAKWGLPKDYPWGAELFGSALVIGHKHGLGQAQENGKR